jgi:hypothetical protein
MSVSTRLKHILPTSGMRIGSCCALALIATLTAPAGSAAASKWTVRQLPPKPLEGGSATDQVPLYGVSCPSESLCVAVGALDTVAFSQSPSGGADRWHVVYPTYDEPKQSCLEEGLPAASCSQPKGAIDGISCATESLCVAVGYEGSVYVSTDPTGGASAWSVTDVNERRNATHLTAVSCPSASRCVAVAGGYGEAAGRILTSTAPASGHWQTTQLGGSPDLRGVSCATPSLCVAVAKGGRIFVSSDPTGGASAWREAGSPTPRDLQAVSCVAALLCAAGDGGGNILTSTDPTGPGATWSEAKAGGPVLITGVSCPTASGCVAVDNNGDVLTSTEPTGGPDSWHAENLVPFEATESEGEFDHNALFAASCASTSLCVLVGSDSRIFTSTNPSGPVAHHKAHNHPRRPRTILVFAENFWRQTDTRHRRFRARFHFYSPTRVRGFECKHDRGPWRRCRSPLRYWVGIGRHALHVRAIGPRGLRGRPAVKRFRVSHPHPQGELSPRQQDARRLSYAHRIADRRR